MTTPDPGTGWIGVGLEGTLARAERASGEREIGEPVPAMLRLVRGWLDQGRRVRILTDRTAGLGTVSRAQMTAEIEVWCLVHLGRVLEVTCCIDRNMVELWDHRARTTDA